MSKKMVAVTIVDVLGNSIHEAVLETMLVSGSVGAAEKAEAREDIYERSDGMLKLEIEEKPVVVSSLIDAVNHAVKKWSETN